ncbi:hypothetical protein BH23PSE1_BH23PSE1_04690 [soil metagenome]
MAAMTIDAESTLTDRYQTTVPEPVRRALRLKKRDRIRYIVQPTGEVLLQRVAGAGEHEDPVIGAFLALLAADMKAHPERVQGFPEGMWERIDALVDGMDADLGAPLAPEDE